MKLLSFCVAAVLLSSNVFAQAKATDLAPTPVTTQAQSNSSVSSPAKAAKPMTSVKSTSKKTALHGKKGHKHARSAANVAKKKLHTASAKTQRATNKSVAR